MITSNKPVTIKSIAQELGISFSTVSKSLNGNPNIKPETREMVINKAKEMGYTPNTLAKGLRGNSTKTIAVVFNDIENPVLTYIFRTISIHMAKHGYTTMILDSKFNGEAERANILTVLSRHVDFIILEPAIKGSSNLKLLQGHEHHMILLGPKITDFRCHQVQVNYKLGGYLSAKELLQKGHRDLLVIAVPLSFPGSSLYIEGIQSAFEEVHETFDMSRFIPASQNIDNSFSLLQDLWNPEKNTYSIPFTGILTFDDMHAYGVYRSARQNRLQIPDDLSVIGFDDNSLCPFSDPPLTTVHLPKERISESCLTIIKSVLLEKQNDFMIYTLEPTLIVRDSVKEIHP